MNEQTRIEPMTVAGNRLTLLADGPERLEALIAPDRRRARNRCGSSIISGRTTSPGGGCATPWSRRRRAASKVSLLVDGFGAADATEAFFQPLVDAEARFCRFVPRWGRRYLLRNHQKLALADGTQGRSSAASTSRTNISARSRRAPGATSACSVEGDERRLPGPLFRRPVRLGGEARRARSGELRRML